MEDIPEEIATGNHYGALRAVIVERTNKIEYIPLKVIVKNVTSGRHVPSHCIKCDCVLAI